MFACKRSGCIYDSLTERIVLARVNLLNKQRRKATKTFMSSYVSVFQIQDNNKILAACLEVS